MITLFIAFYAFVAGLMAEYTHTKLTNEGKDNVTVTSLFVSAIWPVAMWRAIK